MGAQARGWSYGDVLPYFKRAEDNERGANEWHGGGGPLRGVTRSAGATGCGHTSSRPPTALRPGWRTRTSTARPGRRRLATRPPCATGGAEPPRPPTCTPPRTGRTDRRDAPPGAPRRVRERRNARSASRASASPSSSSCARTARSSSAAGAYNSPQLLMLSGIGDPERAHAAADPGRPRGAARRARTSRTIPTPAACGSPRRPGQPAPRGARTPENLALWMTRARGRSRPTSRETGGFMRTGRPARARRPVPHGAGVFAQEGLAAPARARVLALGLRAEAGSRGDGRGRAPPTRPASRSSSTATTASPRTSRPAKRGLRAG